MRIPNTRRGLHMWWDSVVTLLRCGLSPFSIDDQLIQTVEILDHTTLLEDGVELVLGEGREPRDERAVHVLQGCRRAGRYRGEAGAERLVAYAMERAV